MGGHIGEFKYPILFACLDLLSELIRHESQFAISYSVLLFCILIYFDV